VIFSVYGIWSRPRTHRSAMQGPKVAVCSTPANTMGVMFARAGGPIQCVMGLAKAAPHGILYRMGRYNTCFGKISVFWLL